MSDKKLNIFWPKEFFRGKWFSIKPTTSVNLSLTPSGDVNPCLTIKKDNIQIRVINCWNRNNDHTIVIQHNSPDFKKTYYCHGGLFKEYNNIPQELFSFIIDIQEKVLELYQKSLKEYEEAEELKKQQGIEKLNKQNELIIKAILND